MEDIDATAIAADKGAMPAAPEINAKVFVSYSRRDIAFVDKLDAALQSRGIEALIDRQEIFAFEDWWRRIEELIGQADTIVFVLSPDAVASDVCQREVDFAGALNKRFAPVVARAVDPARVPKKLSRLNFIHLDDEAAFEKGVDRLAQALETDIEWVRRHSELGQLARRWFVAGRPGPQGMLLRPPLLDEAENWIASRPANAPVPTEETQALILASRQAATRRRKMLTAALVIGLAFASVLSGVAFWQRQVARENERQAIEARAAETQQRRLAEQREQEAVEAGNRSLIGQSRFLADLAGRAIADRDHGTAVLLALEALPDQREKHARPVVPEAEQVLDRGLAGLAERGVVAKHAGFAIAFSPDGRRLASHGGGELVLGAIESREVTRSQLAGEPLAVEFSPDGRRLLHCFKNGLEIADLAGGATRSFDFQAVTRSPLLACGFGAGGRRILAIGQDGKAGWWDVESSRLAQRVDFGAGKEAVLAASGTRVVVLARDGSARLFDTANGSELVTFSGSGAIEQVALNRDGRRALGVQADGTVRVWDVARGAEISSIRSQLRAALLSPNGGRVVLRAGSSPTGPGGGFEVWDVETGERMAVLDAAARLTSLTFSPDGKRLVGGGADGTVRIYETDSARETSRFAGHYSRVIAAVMSPDGRHVLSSSFDSRVVLWDLEASRPSRQIDLTRAPVSLAPLERGESFLVGAADGSLRRWQTEGGREPAVLLSAGPAVVRLFPSPTGARALAVRADGSAVLVDPRSGFQIATFENAFGANVVSKIDRIQPFSPDGRRIVTLLGSTGAAIRDAHDGKVLRRLPVELGRPGGAIFTPDGKRLVLWSSDGIAATLDAESGERLATIRNMPRNLDGSAMPPGRGADLTMSFESVALSPDGRLLATAGAFQPRIWDIETGEMRSMLLSHEMTGEAGFIRFARDGRTIFTVERGRIVTAWDVETGDRLRSFVGHAGSITSLRLSQDGQRLLTASEDGSARIWDTASGIEIAALRANDRAVRAAVFWPDGLHVGTLSDDGRARLWPIASDLQTFVDQAKLRMGRCLTPTQRRRAYLDPSPPVWCLTGPGLEGEQDPAKWQPLPPYHMPIWQRWFAALRAGKPIGLPRVD